MGITKKLLFICLTSSSPIWAQNKKWTTYWNNAHYEKTDPLSVDPATALPQNPDLFRWVVRPAPNARGADATGNVTTYSLDSSHRTFRATGSIPVGTEITLERVYSYNRVLFYGFLPANQTTPKPTDFSWISGLNVKADSLRSEIEPQQGEAQTATTASSRSDQ